MINKTVIAYAGVLAVFLLALYFGFDDVALQLITDLSEQLTKEISE